MRAKTAGGILVATGLGGALAFFSCGKTQDKAKASSAATASTTATDTSTTSSATSTDTVPAVPDSRATTAGQDVTQAFVLDISNGSVDVPAVALDAGSTLSVDQASTPTDFTKNPNAPAASKAIVIVAKDASGADIPKAKAPLTVAIDLTPVAALDGVEATTSNLCAYALGSDKIFRLWRRAALTVDDATKKVSYASVWLGTFQLFYCGDVVIAGAREVSEDGTKATAVP